MEDKRTIKAHALEQLREYLIINDVEVNDKEDIIEIYLTMRKKGYFLKADMNHWLDDVRSTFKEFADAYSKDKDILEKDLIFFGARKVLEKINANKIKR